MPVNTIANKDAEILSSLDKLNSLNVQTEEKRDNSHILSESLKPITSEESFFEINTETDTVTTFEGIILPNNDVAMWPATITANFIEKCLVKGIKYFQNRLDNYSDTEKQFGEERRRLTLLACFFTVHSKTVLCCL